MTENKAGFILLYIVLCIMLVTLFILERRYPEAGCALMRRLMSFRG